MLCAVQVRARMKDAGLPKPAQVHLVSCVKEIGVKNLLQSLVELVRSRFSHQLTDITLKSAVY